MTRRGQRLRASRGTSRILQMTRTQVGCMSRSDVQALVHELQVHQMELEMQNEELRRAQGELAASRDRYAELYDFAPIGYLTLDTRARIIDINLAAARMLGVERADLAGRQSFQRFVADESRAEWVRHQRSVAAGRGKHACDLVLARADGSRMTAHLECVRLTGQADSRPVVLLAISDVTRAKQAEESLRHINVTLESRVAARTAELRILAERVARAQEDERRRIAAGLHDEVGQLLAACQIKLEQTREGVRKRDRHSLLDAANEMLVAAIEHVRDLTFDLTVAGILETGFSEAVREMCRHMERRFGLQIRVRCPKRGLDVPRGIRFRLYQCLRELVYNVAKHAGSRSATVRMAAEGGVLRIGVLDHGKGFDARAAGHSISPSGGVGLYNIREQLRDTGGRLEIRSAAGEGTQATLLIHLMREPEKEKGTKLE